MQNSVFQPAVYGNLSRFDVISFRVANYEDKNVGCVVVVAVVVVCGRGLTSLIKVRHYVSARSFIGL